MSWGRSRREQPRHIDFVQCALTPQPQNVLLRIEHFQSKPSTLSFWVQQTDAPASQDMFISGNNLGVTKNIYANDCRRHHLYRTDPTLTNLAWHRKRRRKHQQRWYELLCSISGEAITERGNREKWREQILLLQL